jgi:ureidoglycolate dehydrogenase (NAD+)
MKKIKYDNLIQFHKEILNSIGLDEHSVESVTTGLCETSLRGVDSHGVRLLPHYVKSALSGRKNPQPKYIVTKTFPSIGHLDADNAFGHAAGMKSIEFAMEMAETQGIGIVAVSNSSHPGAMASMALKAARKGFIALAFTHADALVLSHNGTRPYFGTNPICMAVPREEKEPYCLDMASSIVSWNKVLVKKNSKTDLIEGIAADSNGNSTIDPDEATCLLPAGAYKGFGIASMVEILCGVYTGMQFGRSIPSMYKASMDEPRHLGQFYMVLRVDGVINKSDFLSTMQAMSDEVRDEPAIDREEVMMPGDPEIKTSKIRMKEGIPLDDVTLDSFIKLSKEHDVKLHFF